MHLSDCFMDVMAYVSYLLKSVETRQPPYEEVKNDIRNLLTKSEGNVTRGNFPRDE